MILTKSSQSKKFILCANFGEISLIGIALSALAWNGKKPDGEDEDLEIRFAAVLLLPTQNPLT